MNAWYPLLKARTVLLFAGALVVVGLVPVLHSLAVFAWKLVALYKALPAMPLLTDYPLYLVLVLAAAGLALVGAGIWLALRQRSAIRALKQRNEDRLRRVQDYRRESSPADHVDGRREPFIGSSRSADRRVA